MTIRFRHLRLRAETDGGTFGADLKFDVGLNILRADNTKGKSTCLQGLIYVLGLEKMLSPRREIPLTYVMTSHLEDPDTGERRNILESSVWAELENAAGVVITVRRDVVSANDRKLVSVFEGPALSDPTRNYRQRDYFVSDPGAAQREAGFHRMLADFIGWTLPAVKRYDGSETTLYLETIFPLVYVEQKAGWSWLPAAFPNYFQIRDVGRRSVEFLLGLETHDIELRKQQIDLDLAAGRSAWMAKLEELQSIARTVNARVEGLTAQPTLASEEVDRAYLLVLEGQTWRPSREVASTLRTTIAQMSSAAIPETEEIAPEAAARLDQLTKEVAEQNAIRGSLFRNRQFEANQVASTRRRLAALEEDLKKNQDAQKLRRFGSTISDTMSADHCPTCAQPIADTLMAQRAATQIMPVEDNIEYIKAQISLFSRLKTQSESTIQNIDRELASVTAQANENSARLRALRNDLIAPSRLPSVSALEERLRLEARLQSLEAAQDRFEQQKLSLVEIARQIGALLREKSGLPSDRLTDGDRTKLAAFVTLLREQAASYGFSTFPSSELELSLDTFRPQKEGFEIGFELSASDTIRLKWAYQLALMELSRNFSTNHPGVVVFDEPRHQEAARLSFQRLLERASLAKTAGQQVIFATSEDLDLLRSMTSHVDCKLHAFDGPIVRRIRP